MADRSYDANHLRRFIVEQGGKPVIPGRHNHKVPIDHDRELYRERNVVKRGIGRSDGATTCDSRLNRELHDRLQDHAAWQARAELPELEHLNKREIAALVGMVPQNRVRGRYRGSPRVRRGPASVRTMLYMTTVAATRHNPAIRASNPLVPSGQVPEDSARRDHAQAAPHPQRRGPGPDPLTLAKRTTLSR